ncbi:hypothetical protein BGZ96_004488 [Linnemannia gamsii]|uniref:Uncharacterized protein n=1 Tax=Linnemannia gamsii TaxID=64522 RepID=A0ABQ7JI85_9FUNG|nr:hypothetical protein BGZ96_004488 [Linnemannia gamsii]
MLAQFPNLEELRVCEADVVYPDDRIPRSIDATMIAKSCPKIRVIELDGSDELSPDYSVDGYDETWPLRVMAALPDESGFKALRLTSTGYPPALRESWVRAAVERHEINLETVEISVSIISPATRAILKTCQGLVNFKVESSFDLEDANGSTPWVCKGLQQLCLKVKVRLSMPTYLSSMSSVKVYKPYYLRLPTKGPPSREVVVFGQLENFYEQIGNLTQLRRLELYFQRGVDLEESFGSDADAVAEETIEVLDWSSSDYYSDDSFPRAYRRDHKKTYMDFISFPAMLSLGDVSKKRPGFLHLFSKLNKLECLAGDMNVRSYENRLTVGKREVEWMMEHWVSL